jgi:hypothetical protein
MNQWVAVYYLLMFAEGGLQPKLTTGHYYCGQN